MSDWPRPMSDETTPGPVLDAFRRPLADLRVSVTDRCNFRCTYCMPADVFGPDHAFLPRASVLTFEEIERVVRCFADLGVRKVRLTGGEPLVRRDLPVLVRRLAAVPGIADLTMTTNGALLPSLARPLAAAGLRRVTVSLDSLDDAVFGAMNGVSFPVARVLDGITAARAAGLAPVKLNSVVKRGVNEASVLPLARFARDQGLVLRFIEYMDAGRTNGWRVEQAVPVAEMVAALDAAFPLEPLPPAYPGEVATRWRYRDGAGEVGFVASVSRPFCRGCTRARLSADGHLYTCLFATRGRDLRQLLRSGADEAVLRSSVTSVWRARADRYSELRTAERVHAPRPEMFAIGG